jgi:hypothetical protein
VGDSKVLKGEGEWNSEHTSSKCDQNHMPRLWTASIFLEEEIEPDKGRD